MLDEISFDAGLIQRATELEVTYTIKNDRTEDIGVFNRLQGIAIDGGLDFSPDAVFTDLEGGVLRMMKMALPIPKGLQISAYTPPHSSLVRAGDSIRETFVLRLPVRVRHPFKRALVRGEVAAVKPATAHACEIVIGVFPCTPAVRLVAEHPAFPDVLTASPPAAALAGQVTLEQRLSLSADVPMLDYVGFPW